MKIEEEGFYVLGEEEYKVLYIRDIKGEYSYYVVYEGLSSDRVDPKEDTWFQKVLDQGLVKYFIPLNDIVRACELFNERDSS